jgi:hypothetical protein
MYCSVPKIVPSPVRGVVCVGNAVTPATASALRTFARPKSSSLVPALGEHDIARFQIPMNHSMFVRGIERGSNVNGTLQHLLDG